MKMGVKVVVNACYGGFGLSDKAVEWLKERGVVDADEYHWRDEAIGYRHHPLLVECVETLGEEASGSYARLRVDEIEGNRYSVSEYDGFEGVRTPKESRWIEVRGVKPTRIDWLYYCALMHDNGHHDVAEELTHLAMLAWDRITNEDVKKFWAAVELAAPKEQVEPEPEDTTGLTKMDPTDLMGLPVLSEKEDD